MSGRASLPARRVGLSYGQLVKPLLSTFSHRPTSKRVKAKEEPNIDDPPQASSSESEDDEPGPAAVASDSDDEGATSTRADIKPTLFKRDSKNKGMIEDGRTGTRRRFGRQLHKAENGRVARMETIDYIRAESEDDDGSPRPQKRIRTKEKLPSVALGAHHAPQFIRSRDKRAYSEQCRAASKTYTMARAPKAKSSTGKFKRPQRISSPAESDPGFDRRKYESPTYATESPKRGFRHVPLLDGMSSDGSPQKPLPRKLRRRKGTSEAGEEGWPLTQNRPFRIPEPLSDVEEGSALHLDESKTAGTPLSSSLTELSTLESDFESLLGDGPARCPMCDAPVNLESVDPEFLHIFSASRVSIAQRRKFCNAHKKRDAQAVSKEKGYPDIDWDNLVSRFGLYDTHLARVLSGKAKSHYRDLLAEKVKSGKGRKLKEGDDLTPGYYGLRGLQAMSEYLLRQFSSALREQAVKDRLIAARGHTAYIQSVLVPELAVRLIMEDLGVENEAARRILRESAQIGSHLHEEIPDVVKTNDESGNDQEQQPATAICSSMDENS